MVHRSFSGRIVGRATGESSSFSTVLPSKIGILAETAVMARMPDGAMRQGNATFPEQRMFSLFISDILVLIHFNVKEI
jgi:hypothetical protein